VRKAKRTIFNSPSGFLKQTRAATAIEYTLIAAGISIAIVAIVFTMGEQLAVMTDDILAYITSRDDTT